MSRARDLSKLSSPSNFTVDTNNNIGVNSTSPDAKLDVIGIVSATSFFGDGSGLTGIANTAIIGADQINVTGVVTATSFVGNVTGNASGTAGGLSGTPDITVGNISASGGDLTIRNITGVAATFTGVLTYEDVTNIDSVGIITAQSDVVIADKIIHLSDTNTAIRFPAADTFTVETAGSETARFTSSNITFKAPDGGSRYFFGEMGNSDSSELSLYNSSDAQKVRISSNQATFFNGGAVLINTTSSTTVWGYGDGSLQLMGDYQEASASFINNEANTNSHAITLGKTRNGSILASGDTFGAIVFSGDDGNGYHAGARIIANVDGTPSDNVMPGRLSFQTGGTGGGSPTERLRIDSSGNFIFKNGAMVENGNIDTTARTGTQNTNLDAGMVVYFSTASTGTWKPNFRISSSVSLNSVMSDGDVISPTTIVAKGATSHYATTIQIDGSDVTPEFLGGAPSDGGGSGTFDSYSYTIIKTANATFKVFASVSNYE